MLAAQHFEEPVRIREDSWQRKQQKERPEARLGKAVQGTEAGRDPHGQVFARLRRARSQARSLQGAWALP